MTEFLNDPILQTQLWIRGMLINSGLPAPWVSVAALGIGALALALVPLIAVIFLVWYERKIVARIGSRIGPNNSGAFAGPWGVLQTFADAVKMLTKEDIIPAAADRWVFNLAPILTLALALSIWAVIPLGKGVIGADPNIGVFYVLALGSGSMIAILMAGWGSDNKYALLAAMRGVATLISYEIPQTLALMTIVMMAGSFSLYDIVEAQAVPFIFAMPLTAFLFLASVLSELGRRPFDLIEADSEIVAGYFIEYSGMKFGMFYLAEFINQLALSIIFTCLFLGGWRGPWIDAAPVLSTVWLALKVLLCMLVIQFCQYTLPRLRIDQILSFNWKFLVPVGLVNLCALALVGKIFPAENDPLLRTGLLLATNMLLIGGIFGVLRKIERETGRGR
jgi:NADH-quinone oxidoreductase subunit H